MTSQGKGWWTDGLVRLGRISQEYAIPPSFNFTIHMGSTLIESTFKIVPRECAPKIILELGNFKKQEIKKGLTWNLFMYTYTQMLSLPLLMSQVINVIRTKFLICLAHNLSFFQTSKKFFLSKLDPFCLVALSLDTKMEFTHFHF